MSLPYVISSGRNYTICLPNWVVSPGHTGLHFPESPTSRWASRLSSGRWNVDQGYSHQWTKDTAIAIRLLINTTKLCLLHTLLGVSHRETGDRGEEEQPGPMVGRPQDPPQVGVQAATCWQLMVL